MDQILIHKKLEALRYCIARVSEKCPSELLQLEESPDLHDIVVLNLTRSVELCVESQPCYRRFGRGSTDQHGCISPRWRCAGETGVAIRATCDDQCLASKVLRVPDQLRT